MESVINSENTVNVPVQMFNRMVRALTFLEGVMKERQETELQWVSKETALQMLGCSERTLDRLKGKHIVYKATGRKHQYFRKSIESYNKIKSNL